MTKTQTAPRTDAHRPASENFDPEAYDVIGYVDFHPEDGYMDDFRRILPMFSNGYRRGPHFTTHQCGHCGARLRYAAFMVREDIKEIILVGEQCLDNRFFESKADFQRLRKNGELNRERRAKQARIANILDENPELVWVTYLPNISDLNWSDFLMDMYRALTQNGYMSPAQRKGCVSAIDKMSAKFWQREAERIERESRAATQKHIGTIGQKGVELTGTVRRIFAGEAFAYYGPTPYTYLVETAEGVVKFTTTASSFDDVDEGDTVTIRGTIKKHTDYKGTPQTILNYVKCMSRVPAP
jgi:hypothetical protein